MTRFWGGNDRHRRVLGMLAGECAARPEVVITGQGQLTLRYAEGPHHLNFNNLLARVRAEPEAAIAAIAHFLAATIPTKTGVDNDNVMFRVMRRVWPGDAQVRLQ